MTKKTEYSYALGIAGYAHDASACVLRDGEVLAFIEQERLDRVKHSTAFPVDAIKKVLQMTNLEMKDIENICYFSQPLRQVSDNLTHFVRYLPGTLKLLTREAAGSNEDSFIKRLLSSSFIGQSLKQHFTDIPKIHYLEHHLCHAASAYYPSLFEESAILTMDGRGESTTTLFAYGEGLKINKLKEIKVPHSLGHIYAAITSHLGFNAFNDEWKVMGLSAYGSDKYLEDFRQIIKIDKKGNLNLDLSWIQFHIEGQKQWLSEKFYKKFGLPRKSTDLIEQIHKDIAYGLQKRIEEVGLILAEQIYAMTKSQNLCLAGGVVLNCLMNSKIIEQGPFQNVFVQPIANDAGTSLGAALLYQHHHRGIEKRHPLRNIYLGPSYTEHEMEEALKEKNLKYKKLNDLDLLEMSAKKLADGHVLSWYQGSMEAGPRALGNRSILADARRKDMKDILNHKIKKREFFRPFAPVVTEESVSQYFDLPKSVKSPYMVLTGVVRETQRDKIPAVTHEDNTARVQTVNREQNAKLHSLLKAFEEKTSVPVLVNTSFNENEPIVCTPQEAVDCFLRTDIDVLVLGNYFVEK